jgi:hypothetical protein
MMQPATAGNPIHRMNILHEKTAGPQLPVSEQLPEEQRNAMFKISDISLMALL